MVQADRLLDDETREQVLVCRGQIDGYIQRYPNFAATLEPWREPAFAPEIVREMIAAGCAAGVGPMAAVAGAVAESVGRKLLDYSRDVVVENGGDVFIKAKGPGTGWTICRHVPLEHEIGNQRGGHTRWHRAVYLLGDGGPLSVDGIGRCRLRGFPFLCPGRCRRNGHWQPDPVAPGDQNGYRLWQTDRRCVGGCGGCRPGNGGMGPG